MNLPQLDTFLWVIPGAFYIYYYNIFTPHKNIKISGWPYLFTIVIIAFVISIPGYFLDSYKKLFSSIIIYICLLCFPRIKIIKDFLPQVEDDFCNKCIEWHKKAVLLTLKNGKVYVGNLWKYPDPNLQYEFQTISIHPSFSGYREQDKKRIEWTTYYPVNENDDKIIDDPDMELIIPRSEIVTFGKFNSEAHEHFEEIKSLKKRYSL